MDIAFLFYSFADGCAISIEPQWLRTTKATPVALFGGMTFANPPLTACTIARITYSFPLPIVFEGQGKEMSFSKRLCKRTYSASGDACSVTDELKNCHSCGSRNPDVLMAYNLWLNTKDLHISLVCGIRAGYGNNGIKISDHRVVGPGGYYPGLALTYRTRNPNGKSLKNGCPKRVSGTIPIPLSPSSLN